MANVVLCKMYDSDQMMSFLALERWRERMVGLLGTDESAAAVALVGCASIHTFGMAYAIDVALVSRTGQVLWSRRSLQPGRIAFRMGAYYALERPSSSDPWPSEESWVGIVKVGGQRVTTTDWPVV